VRVCNDYLADWVEGRTDRLAPVSIVDVDDLDWSICELERMRARGSRAAFVWAAPFEGRSPGHPANDRFWHALTALGMIAIVHIGLTPARFDGGWADAGWTDPGGSGAGGYLRFANSARLEAAQKFVSGLVYGWVAMLAFAQAARAVVQRDGANGLTRANFSPTGSPHWTTSTPAG
jgi:uncharacterized protein